MAHIKQTVVSRFYLVEQIFIHDVRGYHKMVRSLLERISTPYKGMYKKLLIQFHDYFSLKKNKNLDLNFKCKLFESDLTVKQISLRLRIIYTRH